MKTYEVCSIERKITLYVVKANNEEEAKEKYQNNYINDPTIDVIRDDELVIEEV